MYTLHLPQIRSNNALPVLRSTSRKMFNDVLSCHEDRKGVGDEIPALKSEACSLTFEPKLKYCEMITF